MSKSLPSAELYNKQAAFFFFFVDSSFYTKIHIHTRFYLFIFLFFQSLSRISWDNRKDVMVFGHHLMKHLDLNTLLLFVNV